MSVIISETADKTQRTEKTENHMASSERHVRYVEMPKSSHGPPPYFLDIMALAQIENITTEKGLSEI